MRKWRIYWMHNGKSGMRSNNNLFWLLGWAKYIFKDAHINLYEDGVFCDTLHLGALSIVTENRNGVCWTVMADTETGFCYGEENVSDSESFKWWDMA